MTLSVQILIILLGCFLFIAILHAAIHKKIAEPHAILWLIPTVLIIIGGIFPQATYFLSDLFHTDYPPSIIFAFAIIILYFILFECFQTLSVLTRKNKELAAQIALLNQENERILNYLSRQSNIEKNEV